MKVNAYILCYNEEKMIRFTLDYYSKYCDQIFLLDNESTDKSVEIAKTYEKVEVIPWSSGGKYNEQAQVHVKTNARFQFGKDCDWAIMVDMDEIIYGLENLEQLYNLQVKLPGIQGYHMVADSFPEYDGRDITEKIKTGVRAENMDKQSVVSNDVHIQYSLGMHLFNSTEERDTVYPPLKLLHYKWLGTEVLDEKYKGYMKRYPEEYKAAGITEYWQATPDQNAGELRDKLQLLEEVI